MTADYYPSSMDARAAWHANYNKHLPGLAAKYGIDAATLTSVAADNAWMQYWVGARHSADAQKEQLTRYFNTIAGNEDADAPAAIDWELPTPVAAEVAPGIEKRVREQAKFIKGNMDYAAADGILVGIQLPEDSGAVVVPDQPEVIIESLPDFRLKVSFRKKGMSGVRLQVKHGETGKWLAAGTLIVSPGVVAIAPTVEGQPEQVEIRAIYIQGNEEVGNYSPIYTCFIAP